MLSPNDRKREGIGMTSVRTRKRLTDRIRSRGIKNERVLEAMLNTPRHLFIDEALSHRAYEDTALPIGEKQTISQPYIVALMTDLVMEGPQPVKKVLEIGTGCGYQTAVLSQLAARVFTIERIRSLLVATRQRLLELGYHNISYLDGDGYLGWESNRPFDRIIATAAPQTVPPALLDQLAPGGRLVIPVGNDDSQRLRIITRAQSGFSEQQREPVRFVPMLKGRQ